MALAASWSFTSPICVRVESSSCLYTVKKCCISSKICRGSSVMSL